MPIVNLPNLGPIEIDKFGNPIGVAAAPEPEILEPEVTLPEPEPEVEAVPEVLDPHMPPELREQKRQELVAQAGTALNDPAIEEAPSELTRREQKISARMAPKAAKTLEATVPKEDVNIQAALKQTEAEEQAYAVAQAAEEAAIKQQAEKERIEGMGTFERMFKHTIPEMVKKEEQWKEDLTSNDPARRRRALEEANQRIIERNQATQKTIDAHRARGDEESAQNWEEYREKTKAIDEKIDTALKDVDAAKTNVITGTAGGIVTSALGLLLGGVLGGKKGLGVAMKTVSAAIEGAEKGRMRDQQMAMQKIGVLKGLKQDAFEGAKKDDLVIAQKYQAAINKAKVELGKLPPESEGARQLGLFLEELEGKKAAFAAKAREEETKRLYEAKKDNRADIELQLKMVETDLKRAKTAEEIENLRAKRNGLVGRLRRIGGGGGSRQSVVGGMDPDDPKSGDTVTRLIGPPGKNFGKWKWDAERIVWITPDPSKLTKADEGTKWWKASSPEQAKEAKKSMQLANSLAHTIESLQGRLDGKNFDVTIDIAKSAEGRQIAQEVAWALLEYNKQAGLGALAGEDLTLLSQGFLGGKYKNARLSGVLESLENFRQKLNRTAKARLNDAGLPPSAYRRIDSVKALSLSPKKSEKEVLKQQLETDWKAVATGNKDARANLAPRMANLIAVQDGKIQVTNPKTGERSSTKRLDQGALTRPVQLIKEWEKATAGQSGLRKSETAPYMANKILDQLHGARMFDSAVTDPEFRRDFKSLVNIAKKGGQYNRKVENKFNQAWKSRANYQVSRMAQKNPEELKKFWKTSKRNRNQIRALLDEALSGRDRKELIGKLGLGWKDLKQE